MNRSSGERTPPNGRHSPGPRHVSVVMGTVHSPWNGGLDAADGCNTRAEALLAEAVS